MNNIRPAIRHLSESQIQELIHEYYNSKIPLRELRKKYDIKHRSRNLHELFPSIIREELCPRCSCPMHEIYLRTDRSMHAKKTKFLCPECAHESFAEFSEQCDCTFCRRRREEAEKKDNPVLEHLIASYFDKSIKEPVKFADLTLRDKTYLAAVVRSALHDDGVIYGSKLINNSVPISPTHEFAQKIITALVSKDILVFYEYPPRHCIQFNYDTNGAPISVKTWDPFCPNYAINIDGISGPAEEYKLSFVPQISADEPSDEALGIWLDVAIEECVSYMSERISRIRFQFEANMETREIARMALGYFSVSQIRNLIWQTERDLLQYVQKYKVERGLRKELPNKFLLKKIQRAQSEGWAVNNYTLPAQLRPSIIDIVAHEVLEMGDKWEHSPIFYNES